MKFWRPDSSETLRIKEGSEDIGDADTNTGGGVGDRGTRVDKSVGEARVVSIVLGELSEGATDVLDLERTRRHEGRNRVKLQRGVG